MKEKIKKKRPKGMPRWKWREQFEKKERFEKKEESQKTLNYKERLRKIIERLTEEEAKELYKYLQDQLDKYMNYEEKVVDCDNPGVLIQQEQYEGWADEYEGKAEEFLDN